MDHVQKALLELTAAVNRVEGQMTAFVQAANQRFESAEDDIDDLDRRQRKTEGRLHWYAGAAVVLGAIADKFLPGMFGRST